MKLKVLSLVIIASLLASILLIGIGTAQYNKAIDWPKIAVKLPNGTQDMNVSAAPPYDIGDKFNITIEIQNVTEMSAYGITILWNSTYMNMTNWWPLWAPPNWGSALIAFWTNDLRTVAGPWFGLVPPRIGAFVDLSQTAFGAQYNKTGTFALCKIEFRINTYGPHGFYIWKDPANYPDYNYYPGTVPVYWELQQEGAFPEAIHLPYCNVMIAPYADLTEYNVRWSKNPYFAPETHYSGRVSSAMLWIHPPAPYPPVATKTHSPAFPFVDDIVTFTITQTKAGFDGATTRPISSVTIDYGDLSPTNTSAFTPPSIKFYHAYTAKNTYTVKVYCYAAGMPPSLAWCNLTQPITIYEKALTGIDVYEVRKPIWPGDPGGKSGEGTDLPGRPYDPQSLVVLEAYVFYNGEPVQCKIVSFEVTIPRLEQCILYRTDRTGDDPDDPKDADGIAWIEFRIPELCWEYGGPEFYFGKWLVTVTVEMCEVKYMDTMEFDMGYILTLSNMVSVGETFKKCEYVTFDVKVTNIDWLIVPATIILVVYDDNEVPIGQEVVGIDVPAGAFCNPKTITVRLALHIPKYAYVGTERPIGYINLFTALPSECGLAYCPEVSDRFVILAS